MSEYMRQTPPAKTLDNIDHTGTLFEALHPAQTPPVPPSPPIVAAKRRQRIHEHRHPLTIEQRQERIARRCGQEAIDLALDRPYHDLGGHASDAFEELAGDPFEALVEKAEPWMRDIRLVVDRYGVPELTVPEIGAMTKPDQKALALHFDGFMVRLKAAHRLIAAADGDVTAYAVLERRYGKRTREEMIAYLPILEELHEALHERGIAQELRRVAYEVAPDSNKREEMRRRDDRLHGYPQVFFDGTKPRIERLPHHDDRYRPIS